MKRRLVIFFGALAMLLVAFGVYWLTAEKVAFFRPKRLHLDHPEYRDKLRPGTMDAPLGTGAVVVERDSTGRTTAIYRASWEKQTENTYKLEAPSVEYCPRDGRNVYVWADEGWAHAEEAAGDLEVRRGQLSGNVRIVFDLSGRPLPPDKTPEEAYELLVKRRGNLVRIYTDEVNFDNDELVLYTNKRVTLLSPQADILGRGLRVEWNDYPRELRLLRIDQGDWMAVKQLPAGMGLLGPTSPGKPQPRDLSATTTTATATAEPAPPRLAEAAGKKTIPTATGPTQPATPTSPKGKPEPMNVYAATFHGTEWPVHVDFLDFDPNAAEQERQRYIHGARELSLQFEWDTEWRPWRAEEEPPGSATRPVEQAATAPGTQATGPSQTQPATSQPAEPSAPPRDELMLITWSGPLTITPVGRTPAPKRDRYEVSGKGAKVILADAENKAICQEFLFRQPAQSGELRGTPETPARMELRGGNVVECRAASFGPGEVATQRYVRFEGPGHMIAASEAVTPAETTSRPTATAPAEQPKADQIAFGDYAEVILEEIAPSPEELSGELDFAIKTADFVGDVKLTRADSDEYLRADQLHADMARSDRGRDYPRQAVATGNVEAKQADGLIRANSVTIDFALEEKTDPNTTKVRENILPVHMLAEGNVRAEYTDPNDPNGGPITAIAHKIDSDLTTTTHRLYGREGTPAKIVRMTQTRGEESISGKELVLNEDKRTGESVGRGQLKFQASEGLSGELPEPVPAVVTWRDGMSFDDRGPSVDFFGGVTFDVGGGLDHMKCDGTLSLLFTQPAEKKADKAAADVADRPPKPLGIAAGAEQYKRGASIAIANKNVEVRSSRFDKDGNLEQRILLTAAEKLVYNAKLREMNVWGPGTFTAEDYRPPEEQPDQPAGAIPETLERPWQTAFTWKKLMTFSQNLGTVTLKEEVFMAHCSGRRIVAAEGIKHRPWGALPDGRLTKLWCDSLHAGFPTEKPKQTAGAEPSRQPGRRLDFGKLNQLSATGNVSVRDESKEVADVRCEMLLYSRSDETELFTIHGSLPGRPVADASVSLKRPGDEVAQVTRGRQIIYDLRTQTAIVTEVRGGGTR